MGWEWMAIFILGGAAAIILELFVPGGILGTLGIVLLLAAVGAAYASFGMDGAAYVLLAEVVFIGIGIYLWASYFPKSRWGRKIVVHEVIEDAAFAHRFDGLEGKSGQVVAPCHPSGMVEIDGQRYDVESEAGLLAVDTEVTVVQVEGNRVVVRPAPISTNN